MGQEPGWWDRLLVHLACWCRDRMTLTTKYHFDREAYERMGKLLEWRH